MGFGDGEVTVRNVKGFFYVFYFMYRVFGNGYFVTEMAIGVEWLLVFFGCAFWVLKLGL